MIGALECLLFVSGEPAQLAELARALQSDEIEVERGLRELQVVLTERGSGLQLLQIAGGWQLSTRAEHVETIGRLMARGSSKLSRASMETLAVVAYRQPITTPEVEAVRGVSSGGVLKTLLERRLIHEVGRKETLGRPILYATTADFLHYFGIDDLSQLPMLDADTPPPTPVTAEQIADGRSPLNEAPAAPSGDALSYAMPKGGRVPDVSIPGVDEDRRPEFAELERHGSPGAAPPVEGVEGGGESGIAVVRTLPRAPRDTDDHTAVNGSEPDARQAPGGEDRD